MRENEPHSEKENNPEAVASNAVSAVENRDAMDSVMSSELGTKFKEFSKTTGKVAGAGLIYGLAGVYRITKGILQFSMEAIKNKGNIGFKKGYEIGKDIFSLEEKK